MNRNVFFAASSIYLFFMLSGCDASSTPVGFDTPRGGELYVIGQTQQVRLTTTVRAKSVLIEISDDGGVTFQTVGTIDNTVKDPTKRNVLTWTVAGPASTNCILRATFESRAGSFSVTSGGFVIIASPSVTGAFASLSAPNTFSTGPQIIETGSDAINGLIVKGNSSGQTGDLQQWQGSSGNVVAALSPTGALSVTSLTAAKVMFSSTETVASGSDGAQALLVMGNSPTQTANLQEWQSSNGTVLASMSSAGAMTAASFNGNGSALTNLNAGALNSGTLPDARLSANVAMLSANPQLFTGVNTFSAAGSALNVTNVATLGNVVIGGGTLIKKHLSVSANLVFPTFPLLGLGCSDQTVTVTGANFGDTVTVGIPSAPPTNSTVCAFVSAANTVTIRWANILLPPAANPPNGTYRVDVWQH